MSAGRKEWAEAATKAVGVWPGDLGTRRDRISIHAKTIWFGIVKENCPKIGLKELSELGGLRATAHSSCHACWARWQNLPWKERHGWLVLSDSLCGPILKQRQWEVARLHSEAVEAAKETAAETRKRQTFKPFRRIQIKGHYDER